jgi:acetyl esterase/lipase
MEASKSVIRSVLRGARPLFGSRRMGVVGRRVMLATLTAAARPPRGTRFDRITVADVPVDRLQVSQTTSNGILIYIHGGAYALGSAKGYRGLAAQVAAAAGMTVMLPDYSRAPDAQYPVALEEMVGVYTQLLRDGLDPEAIVIAGDSAGGGLTLALAMTLRDRGIALPAALGLICPWADLALDVDEKRPVLRDPLILPYMCAEWAPRYVGSADPRLPGISPVYGDMAGLPPIIMQTACDDPISVDADKIEIACAASKTALDHRRFDGMWHDFHLQASLLPDARDAVTDLGAKLRAAASLPERSQPQLRKVTTK